MKRKFLHKLSITVAITMLGAVVFAGCGSDAADNKENGGSADSSSQSTAQSSEELPKEYVPADPTSVANENEDRKNGPRGEVFELFSKMNVGWNLGNTLDAHGAGNSLKSETYWGNPKTTKEMIDEIAKQGINTIRIPVTWAEHVGEAPDYTIDPEWMDRVQETVDYAAANDMYIILDTHHEPDFWLIPDEQHKEEATAELTAIWAQVAERFRDYDEKLLFEGMNEPRVKGSSAEWNGGTAPERVIINEWNKAFLETVRATGGNNENRVLILCTYGHNASYSAINELEIPEDDHIAVAVHLYTPYFFTYEPSSGSVNVWDGSLKKDIVGNMAEVNADLIKKDVPVIITEFGAVNKGNTQETLKWLADYMAVTNRYGIKCIWWDNGNYTSSGEKFGIFDRKSLSWYDQEIADALVKFAGGTGAN